MTDAADTAVENSSQDIVARADFQYRWRVWALFLLVFGYGCWSAWDGFVNWPRQNETWLLMKMQGKVPPRALHSDWDILLNQSLGIALPAVGLLAFIWLAYRSRGEYRLSGQTLHLPGHQPIPLAGITALDKTKWDRKGIAVIEYKLPDGATRKAALRDMVYQRAATDSIVHRIESHLDPAAADAHADPAAT